MTKINGRARLMASGAFIVVASGAYAPRMAFAGSCVGPDNAIVCSGPADAVNDVQQNLSNGNPIVVSTEPGFGLDTSRDVNFDGLNLFGNDATFTDENGSVIVAGRSALVAGSGTLVVESDGSFQSINGTTILSRSQLTSADVTITGDITAGGMVNTAVSLNTDGEASVTLGGTITATGRGVSITRGNGFGDTMVDTSSATISAVQHGVYAVARNTNAIYIDAGNVSSTQAPAAQTYSGIRALHKGSGYTEITSSGTVSSTSGDGIFARSLSGSTLYVNNVSGAENGIFLSSQNYTGGMFSTNSSINISGDVTGGNGAGVSLSHVGDEYRLYSDIQVTVNGSLSSDSGVALEDNGGSTRLRVNAGGSISGDVRFGDGSDTFEASGGDLTNLGIVYGGGAFGDDAISVTADSMITGSKFTGFERFSITPDKKRQPPDGFIAPSTTATFADNDSLTLDGDFGQVFILNGGVLQAGNNLTITSARGVILDGSRTFYGEGSDVIGVVPGGTLRTGGMPGQGLITINATDPGGTGISGSGTIDMQNGVPGDNVVVNGRLQLFAADGNDILKVDIDPAIEGADLVTVRDNVSAYGNINVNVVNITRTGETDHVVIRSTSGTINEYANNQNAVGPMEGLGQADAPPLTASTDSVAATVEANIVDNEVVVTVTTDFTPVVEPVDPVDPDGPGVDPTLSNDGLSANGVAFGEFLNNVLNDPALADIRALALSATSIEELEAIYASLGGSDFNAPLFSSLIGGLGFGSGLFSCAVGEGPNAAIDEGQCGWTRIGGSYTDRDGRVGNPGGDENLFSVAAGGQFIVDDHIRLGAGIGFTTIDSTGDLGLQFDGNRVHAGVSAKYVDGPMMVGISAAAGVTFSDTERTLVTGAVANGDFEIYDFSLLARAAYLFDVGDGLYVKPQIQGGVTHVSRDGFTETGAGAANLQVSSESETFFSVSPSVEFGGDFELDEGMKIRPYVRVGATVLSEDTIDTTARFAASASPLTFTTSVERDDLFGEVAAGFVVFSDEELSVRAEYQGRFAEDSQSHGGFLKLQLKF